MSFQDRGITCRDCSQEFVFTAGEQEFYASKGLQNDPARCPDCRNSRRSARSALENDAGYIRYGGAASFGGRTPRQMHPAACSLCGDMIEVPFIPRGDRPVYCSTVKRMLTQEYPIEEIGLKWGPRPCQDQPVIQALRNGVPMPEPAGAAVVAQPAASADTTDAPATTQPPEMAQDAEQVPTSVEPVATADSPTADSPAADPPAADPPAAPDDAGSAPPSA